MLSPPAAQTSYVDKVAQTVDTLVFSEDDLDAVLEELHPQLTAAFAVQLFPQPLEFDGQAARLALAQSLGLVAALGNISDTSASALEAIMLRTGFLDEADHEEICTLKGVMIDVSHLAAIDHARLACSPGAQDEVDRLVRVRKASAEIMALRGYAARYYAALTPC